MDKKLKRINKLYPWYSGLSNDLIFFITINTIWLSTIKGFTPSQIAFLSTISSLFAIIFQYPSLLIIKKIGNTKSIRIGSLFLLISSIMLTFCTKYTFFAIANIFSEMSLVFETMSAILLKNNLEYLNLNDKYIKIRSQSSLVYAISTTLIALLIGILFNIHNYLPMLLGIITCLLCFIFSLFIFDIDDKIMNKEICKKKKVKNKSFLKPFNPLFLIFLFYGISFGIVVIGQQNSKLLIQYQLLDFFSIETVATSLGIILFVSRIVRVIANYIYPKIYIKLKNKTSLLLSLLLLISIILILLGSYLNVNIYIKIVIMTLGFSIFTSLRDPIKIYIQNLILETFEKKHHKDIFMCLSLSRSIGKFLFGLFASYLLLQFPLQYLFISFCIDTIPLIFISIKINKYVNIKHYI